MRACRQSSCSEAFCNHQLGLIAEIMQVYKATLDGIKCVAVKYFHMDQLDEAGHGRFAAEASLLSAMRDQNIVSCVGAWLQSNQAFMVS